MATKSVFPSCLDSDRFASVGEHAMSRCQQRQSIDPEWFYLLVTACQRLAGDTIEPDKYRFLRAFARFSTDLPEPGSPVEYFVLQQCAVSCAHQAGHQFHRGFHARLAPGTCGRAVTDGMGVFWPGSGSPRTDVLRWASDFLRVFEREHEWPLAVRAQWVLQRRTCGRLDVAAVAREIGCSSSVLTKTFRAAFGMTMSEYLRRIRLRQAIVALRQENSKVIAVAFDAGYTSAKNFYRALYEVVGLTPGDVRALSEAQVKQLCHRQLADPSYRVR